MVKTLARDIFFDAKSPPAPTMPVKPTPTTTAAIIADEFETFLNRWHSTPEIYDNDLDAWIHRIYADSFAGPVTMPPSSIPYFSPSSASSCRRELYEKLRGASKDVVAIPSHQGRWKRIGTAIGDVLQRDILMAERHYTELTGQPLRFSFERNHDGTPMFEDFAKVAHVTQHNGKTFALFGTCDGIMRYVSEDGEIIRVGLEIKSKQTTAAQTSEFSTRNGPKPDHVKQCTAYGIMYDVDFYVILYVNASKKAWEMSDIEFAKNPDIKVFGVEITSDMKMALLDDLAEVVNAVDMETPPLMDIERFAFNNYKRACALSLTETEVTNLAVYADAVQRSSLPDWQKREPANAIQFIREVRSHGQTSTG